MTLSIENKIKLGAGIMVAVLLINAVVSYRATGTLVNNEHRVSHTYQVLTELEVTLSTVKDAETGERGYIITGSDAYLEPYQAALAQIDDHVRKLKELTADNPARQADIPVLERKIADRLDSLKGGIALRRSGDTEGAVELISSGIGKRMMDDLRQFINGMEADETQLLNQRMEESRKSQNRTIFTFIFANLVACVVLLLIAAISISGIAARRRSAAALHEQRQLLEVTLSSISDAVIACDIHGSITFLNPAAQSLTGWKREEAERQPLPKVFNIINEDTRQTVENPALRAMREGTIIGLANHTVLVTKDGGEIPVDDGASPITTADARTLGAVLIFRDITERRRAETERARLLAAEHDARGLAEAANRAKDEFLAVLSHELRTPLTAVFGWVQLLQRRGIDSETQAKALEVIDRNLRVQTRLVDDLLSVSQIMSGKLQIRREIIDPLQVLKTAVAMARPSADAKDVALRLESDEHVPALFADPSRLQQITGSLLSNALKFTPKGGTIVASIRRVQNELQIAVSDTGEGISPEFLPQVFNRFSQADASTSRPHGGLGLGLALVRQLVELHGGTVKALSLGIGKGSTFMVSFPLAAVIAKFPEPAASAGKKHIGADLHNIKVLLVEDEPDTREVIAYVLQEFGASVAQASSASDALLEFVTAKPDILVSDIGMPDMNGYQLLAMIQNQTPQPPPAVALTAYATAADKDRALRSGFQAHMSKPVALADLVALVAELVSRARAS